MDTIHILTSNAGKFREIRTSLSSTGKTIQQLDLPHPEIQSDSLEEVVRFKVEWARRARPGITILADDSGLFIDSLGGFPGVYSSYALKTIGCEGILRLLDGTSAGKRGAHFECCLALTLPNRGVGDSLVFKGIVKGKISKSMDGKNGFGFDPVFIPEGKKETFAQMTLVQKNDISHRGRAIEALVKYLNRGK